MNNTPPEVIERWQAEFIEWIWREHSVRVAFDGGAVSVLPINGRRPGIAVPLVAGVAWQAWKDARQSVRIALPHTLPFGEDESDHFYNAGLFDCSQAIQCQGYKVNN